MDTVYSSPTKEMAGPIKAKYTPKINDQHRSKQVVLVVKKFKSPPKGTPGSGTQQTFRSTADGKLNRSKYWAAFARTDALLELGPFHIYIQRVAHNGMPCEDGCIYITQPAAKPEEGAKRQRAVFEPSVTPDGESFQIELLTRRHFPALRSLNLGRDRPFRGLRLVVEVGGMKLATDTFQTLTKLPAEDAPSSCDELTLHLITKPEKLWKEKRRVGTRDQSSKKRVKKDVTPEQEKSLESKQVRPPKDKKDKKDKKVNKTMKTVKKTVSKKDKTVKKDKAVKKDRKVKMKTVDIKDNQGKEDVTTIVEPADEVGDGDVSDAETTSTHSFAMEDWHSSGGDSLLLPEMPVDHQLSFNSASDIQSPSCWYGEPDDFGDMDDLLQCSLPWRVTTPVEDALDGFEDLASTFGIH